MKILALPARGYRCHCTPDGRTPNGTEITHIAIWNGFEKLLDEDTARWMGRAIQAGEEKAKAELRKFLGLS